MLQVGLGALQLVAGQTGFDVCLNLIGSCCIEQRWLDRERIKLEAQGML